MLVSLEMFNREGVQNVSTNHIADEMDISPGNLYYHYKNKDAIVIALFERYKKRIDTLLLTPEERSLDPEDLWFFLHLVFEAIWEYRFIYRNLIHLTNGIRKLRLAMPYIINRKVQAAVSISHGLMNNGVMSAKESEVEALGINVAVVTTYWLNFAAVRAGDRRNIEFDNAEDIGSAVFQVMALFAPYLREPERSYLRVLAKAYLS